MAEAGKAAASLEVVDVAIIGGGLAGLVLARVLQHKGYGRSYAVFERDASREARSQGGVLDMHAESGQWALAQAGLTQGFEALIHPDGEDTIITDSTGTVLYEESQSARNRPEADRSELRNLLLDNLEPSTVRWGHKFVSATQEEGGTWKLTFDGRPSVRARLLVGADGSASRIRPLVTDVTPVYTGISFIGLATPDHTDDKYPSIAKFAGKGGLFALGGDRAILSHKTSKGSFFAYAAFRMPSDGWAETLGINASSSDEKVRQALLTRFAEWPAAVHDLIRCAEAPLERRPIVAMPTGTTWTSKGTVTLIGDAAHVTSPFAGEGANMAMRDAADLALELIKLATGDFAKAIQAYEAKMFPRARAAARQSSAGLELCFAPEGGVVLSDVFRLMSWPTSSSVSIWWNDGPRFRRAVRNLVTFITA